MKSYQVAQLLTNHKNKTKTNNNNNSSSSNLPTVSVVKEARTTMSVLWTLSYDKSGTMVNSGGKYVMQTSYCCNSNRSSVPLKLSTFGVSATSWAKIVDVCNNELLLAMKASDESDGLLARQMESYTGNQMMKGVIGFGQESSHEKKVLKMIHEAAILNNNTSLLTYKVVTLANALLNKHNVMVQPTFVATAKSLKTCGLAFVLMDE
jgi:hypothetical protein